MQNNIQSYAVISVKEPVLQNAPNQSIPSFVTYLVTGIDPHGQFNIRRRFRQFLLLRNKLVQRFIGIYIPPIPSKRAAGNTEERYVEERRKFLHYFCQKISQRPFMFDSDIFQTFIRGDPDFQRATRYIPSHQYALIANIYDVEYRQFAQQNDMSQVIVGIESQSQNLKLVEKRLTAISNQLQEILQVKRQFVNQYAQCFKITLPKYEQEFIAVHDTSPDVLFVSSNQSYKQKLSEYLHFSEANLIQDYIEMITYDIRQARAFLEAIQSRRNFENKKINFETVRRSSKQQLQKLKSGRTTLKSIFTSGKKDEQIKQLQNQIPQYERNQQFLDMCLPLSAISIYRDLIQFKRSRSIEYLAHLQIVAQKEMRLLNTYGSILITVLDKEYSNKQNQKEQEIQKEKEF